MGEELLPVPPLFPCDGDVLGVLPEPTANPLDPPPPEPPFLPRSSLVPPPPAPPPAEVIVDKPVPEIEEEEPSFADVLGLKTVQALPPSPTVTVITVPAVTD